MLKVLQRYHENPTLKNAQAVRSYERSHPMARFMLTMELDNLLADAIHHANKGSR